MADGSIDISAKPTEEVSVRDVFGIDTDMKVHGFAERSDRVPELDSTYKFDPDTTLASPTRRWRSSQASTTTAA